MRWITGITRRDRIRNHNIRQRFGDAAIEDKLRVSRLRMFGHAFCAEEDTVIKIGLEVEISGKRPRRRFETSWHPDHAHDKTKWRQRTSKAVPLLNGTNAEEEDETKKIVRLTPDSQASFGARFARPKVR